MVCYQLNNDLVYEILVFADNDARRTGHVDGKFI